MGRSEAGSDAYSGGYPREQPEHDATVSAFSLDKYEVTVGRFRRFLNAYEGPPTFDQGGHPAIPLSGWRTDWNVDMPADKAELAASLQCDEFATWTTD